jgi:hypothetical protein
MKLIFSYALIILLPLITVGENWFFLTKYKSMRNDITLRIKSDATSEQLFFLKSKSSKSDFYRINHVKEFKFNNQLFDVVKKKEFSDGTFEFALAKDIQEEILFPNLELLTHENKWIQSFHVFFSSPLSLIFSDELESIHQELITIPIQVMKNYNHFLQKQISQYHISIEIPPEYTLFV